MHHMQFIMYTVYISLNPLNTQQFRPFMQKNVFNRAGFKTHTKFILAPGKNIHNTYISWMQQITVITHLLKRKKKNIKFYPLSSYETICWFCVFTLQTFKYPC
jgi:phenylpropionate dioxygenase-like ring-hydroxylating dioxygenase large terminal subunit